MVEARTDQELHRLLTDLASGLLEQQWEARRILALHPPLRMAPLLVQRLDTAQEYRPFFVFGHLLISYDLDISVQTLQDHAWRRHARRETAINLLALCPHDAVDKALAELIEGGDYRQKRTAAAALARRGTLTAVAPLCALAMDANVGLRSEARHLLLQFGTPRDLCRQVIGEMTISNLDAAHILQVLASIGGFNARYLIEEETVRFQPALLERAVAVAGLLRTHMMLVRAATPVPDLLLPARNPDSTRGDDKVRPLEKPEDRDGS